MSGNHAQPLEAPAPLKRTLRIVVGGARGVGKTTVLSDIQRLRSDLDVVHVSRELSKLASQRGLDGFRTLTPELKAELRAEFAHAQAIACGTPRSMMFDLHYVDVDEGVDTIQPDELLRHVDVFVLLQADHSTVLNRRRADGTRARSLDPSHVALEQAAELAMMETLARRYDRPAIRVDNDGPPQDVAQRLLQLLDRL